ncbi:MAG: GNAT family N-acetyltransferase [Chloroflexi bacterium]|nr:GNAT family N-acetyltransferase [Chloroflexota bacterium]
MTAVVKAVETPQEMAQSKALRLQVFVEEQGIPAEAEMDELDATAFHAIAFQDGSVVGTGRLLADSPADGRIGRMAVAQPFRRQGVGSQVLAFLEREASRRGIRRITLHAQAHVQVFYAHRSYREVGQPFLEVGIPHVEMVKELL